MRSNRIFRRIYKNFFRKSRLSVYENYIRQLINSHYVFCTIIDFWELIKTNSIDQKKKYCIIRHDIDTDPKTAYELFKIEKKYNIRSTYYYRLKTIDNKSMKEMKMFGCEIGYHYEELATFAKKRKLKNKNEIDDNLKLIQQNFIQNFNKFKSKWGYASIASHGDFINKYLSLPNYYLLNEDIRNTCKIEIEAYDDKFMKYVTSRITDLGIIDGVWSPMSLTDAIKNDEKVLYILIHPRQWHSRIWSNIKEDSCRFIETIKYAYL